MNMGMRLAITPGYGKKKKRDEKVTMLHLSVSGSYLEDNNFWYMLGMCLSIKRLNRNENIKFDKKEKGSFEGHCL